MKKLAIIVTHPIQYYAPVFKLLAQRLQVMIFYTWGKASQDKFDPGFGKKINWDIDLLDGYDYTWVKNTATDPGSHHFSGIKNPELIDQIEAWAPDSLLVYGWSYHSHLKVLKFFKNKIPILFRGDSTLLDKKPGFINILRTAYLKWVYSHINVAFYVGTNNQAYFRKYGLREEQLIFAPHATDNNRFGADRNTEAQTLRHDLSIPLNSTMLLFAGKFEDVKSPENLLKAFLSTNDPEAHLVYVGNGPLESNLKDIANGHLNVHFIDFQNQSYMPVIYQACDIYCMPSKSETWGLAANEAMACGKALLLSDRVGCAVDLVKQGINGFIYNFDSSTDLSEKLLLLIKSGKNQLAEMGKNSEDIIKSWTFEAQANAIINYNKQDGE